MRSSSGSSQQLFDAIRSEGTAASAHLKLREEDLEMGGEAGPGDLELGCGCAGEAGGQAAAAPIAIQAAKNMKRRMGDRRTGAAPRTSVQVVQPVVHDENVPVLAEPVRGQRPVVVPRHLQEHNEGPACARAGAGARAPLSQQSSGDLWHRPLARRAPPSARQSARPFSPPVVLLPNVYSTGLSTMS